MENNTSYIYETILPAVQKIQRETFFDRQIRISVDTSHNYLSVCVYVSEGSIYRCNCFCFSGYRGKQCLDRRLRGIIHFIRSVREYIAIHTPMPVIEYDKFIDIVDCLSRYHLQSRWLIESVHEDEKAVRIFGGEDSGLVLKEGKYLAIYVNEDDFTFNEIKRIFRKDVCRFLHTDTDETIVLLKIA